MENTITLEEFLSRLDEINTAEQDKLIKEQEEYEANIKAEEKREFKQKMIFIAVALIIGLVIFTVNEIHKITTYNSAVNHYQQGEYIKAYEEFYSLEKFKDSRDYRKILREEHPNDVNFKCEGETIEIGKYNIKDSEFDPETGEDVLEKSEITWIVVKKEDDRALLVSREVLASMPYKKSKDEPKSTSWKESTVRKWLNDDFYDEAFSKKEKKRILTTDVSNSDPYKYATPGADTQDKIFLLSKKELDEYMTDKDWMKAKETEYLREKNGDEGFLSNNPQKYRWWTRDVCLDTTKAVYVKTNGSVKDEGSNTNNEYMGVRPAMWISIN
ncbi:MAG: DUF6273 domain-containing protein [Eubacterium sp.]